MYKRQMIIRTSDIHNIIKDFFLVFLLSIIIEKIQFIKTIKKEINKLPNTDAICIRTVSYTHLVLQKSVFMFINGGR